MKTYKYVYDVYMLTIEHSIVHTSPMGVDFYEKTNPKFPTPDEILLYLKDTYAESSEYFSPHLTDHPNYFSACMKVCPSALKIGPFKYIVVNNIRRI